MKTRWLAALIAPVLWLPFMGWTQDKYPSRAINVVSPFPPGGKRLARVVQRIGKLEAK